MDYFSYLIPQVGAFSDSDTEVPLSVHLEISCPSAGSALSAYLEFEVSVDRCLVDAPVTVDTPDPFEIAVRAPSREKG